MNVAAVPVIILSVDATPINPEPSPEKLLAVTTPVILTLPAPVNPYPTGNQAPFSISIAPVPSLSVILFALILDINLQDIQVNCIYTMWEDSKYQV